jgi:hypothetical protein
MLTSKQRAYLRGLGQSCPAIIQIGKGGISENLIKTVSDALMLDASIGYTTCIPRNEVIDLQRGKVHYGMLPVWMLSTEWSGKRYMFAVNGQTGKTVGDLPVNKGKVVKTFAAIAAAVAAIGCAIVALM